MMRRRRLNAKRGYAIAKRLHYFWTVYNLSTAGVIFSH